MKHDTRLKIGDAMLRMLPQATLHDQISSNGLHCLAALRENLMQELGITSIADRLLLEAALIGYISFLGLQDAASQNMQQTDFHAHQRLDTHLRHSLNGLRIFQETIALLRAQQKPEVKIVVKDSCINVAENQQINNHESKNGSAEPK